MENPEVLIGIHGYDSNVVGGRPFSEVMEDRIAEAVCFLSSTGFSSVVIVVMGGERVHRVVRDKFPNLVRNHEFMMTEEKADTRSEVRFLIEKSIESGFDICFSVSSKDHVSRIAEYWGEEYSGSELEYAVVPSSKTYSESNEEPVVIEAGLYQKIRDVIANNLKEINKSEIDNVAEELEEVFKKHEN